MPHLPRLRVLNCCNNSIPSGRGLANCPGLEELWLASNSLASFADVAPLADAGSLTAVVLHQNPVLRSARSAAAIRCVAGLPTAASQVDPASPSLPPQPVPHPLPAPASASRRTSHYLRRARAGVALLPDDRRDAASRRHGPTHRGGGPGHPCLPRLHLAQRITPAVTHTGRAEPDRGSSRAHDRPEAAPRCITRVGSAAPTLARALPGTCSGGRCHVHRRRFGYAARRLAQRRGQGSACLCAAHRCWGGRRAGDLVPAAAGGRQAAPGGPRCPRIRGRGLPVVAERQARRLHVQVRPRCGSLRTPPRRLPRCASPAAARRRRAGTQAPTPHFPSPYPRARQMALDASGVGIANYATGAVAITWSGNGAGSVMTPKGGCSSTVADPATPRGSLLTTLWPQSCRCDGHDVGPGRGGDPCGGRSGIRGQLHQSAAIPRALALLLCPPGQGPGCGAIRRARAPSRAAAFQRGRHQGAWLLLGAA